MAGGDSLLLASQINSVDRRYYFGERVSRLKCFNLNDLVNYARKQVPVPLDRRNRLTADCFYALGRYRRRDYDDDYSRLLLEYKENCGWQEGKSSKRKNARFFANCIASILGSWP